MHRRGSLAPGATSVSPLISRAICNCAWPSRVSICRARMALAMSRRITATLTFRAAAISWWVKPSASQSNEASRSAALHLVVRETEFCGLRLAGYFRRRMRENSRNSVRRPRCASLTRRNYGGFCLPGNRPGLSGLHGGGRSPAEPVSNGGYPIGPQICRRSLSSNQNCSYRAAQKENSLLTGKLSGNFNLSLSGDSQPSAPKPLAKKSNLYPIPQTACGRPGKSVSTIREFQGWTVANSWDQVGLRAHFRA